MLKREEVIAAVRRMRDSSKQRNFQQSVDMTVNFRGIDFKKAENQIDISVEMPHSTGKASTAKVVVFAKDKEFAAALRGKAQKIILEHEIAGLRKKDVESLVGNYEVFLAEGPAMLTVAKYLGQQLAPRGKMPKPIQPTIAAYEQAAKQGSAGVRISNKKGKFMPLVHVTVGNEKNKDEELADNAMAVYNALLPALERKQHNIKSIYLKLTMGSPVRIGGQEKAD